MYCDFDKFEPPFPKKALCSHCLKQRRIFYGRVIKECDYRDKKISYVEITGWCSYCGWPVDVPGMWDDELSRIQKEWRLQKDEDENTCS